MVAVTLPAYGYTELAILALKLARLARGWCWKTFQIVRMKVYYSGIDYWEISWFWSSETWHEDTYLKLSRDPHVSVARAKFSGLKRYNVAKSKKNAICNFFWCFDDMFIHENWLIGKGGPITIILTWLTRLGSVADEPRTLSFKKSTRAINDSLER